MTAPIPDLHEVEHWLTALRLLPDTRAIAALMKSGMQMPAGVQYLFGEMLNPGSPPLTSMRVIPKRSRALNRAVDKLNASREYKHRMSAGQSSQDAALDIAERFGMDERQIYRWVAEDMPKQFEERVSSLTKIASGNVSDAAEQIAHHADDSANHLVLGAMSMSS